MEDKINYCNLMLSAYYGVLEMDEYSLKEYVLLNISKALNEYIIKNDVIYDIDIEKENILKTPLAIRLKDAIIILNQMAESQELLHLIKEKIRSIED